MDRLLRVVVPGQQQLKAFDACRTIDKLEIKEFVALHGWEDRICGVCLINEILFNQLAADFTVLFPVRIENHTHTGTGPYPGTPACLIARSG